MATASEKLDTARPESGSASLPTEWVPWSCPDDVDALSADQAKPRQNVLLVAEIANTHEGRWEDALRLVEASANAGCGAVKFQKYYAAEMLGERNTL